MATQINPQDFHQAWHQVLAPWLTVLTPLTIVGLAWRLRGYVDNLVHNHLAHAKTDIIDAVKDGVTLQSDEHRAIVTSVRDSSDRIVDALISLKK